MSIFDFLKPKKNTASIAKERLRIIVAQERSHRGAPDYLPYSADVYRYFRLLAAATPRVRVVTVGGGYGHAITTAYCPDVGPASIVTSLESPTTGERR